MNDPLSVLVNLTKTFSVEPIGFRAEFKSCCWLIFLIQNIDALKKRFSTQLVDIIREQLLSNIRRRSLEHCSKVRAGECTASTPHLMLVTLAAVPTETAA